MFDHDTVVDAALKVFRERGYHAASVADLSAAMLLTPGSIYKAFADKRAIFLAAFDRYTMQRSEHLLLKLARGVRRAGEGQGGAGGLRRLVCRRRG